MAWTAPRTWVTGEIVTSSIMNTDQRDNSLAGLGPNGVNIANLNSFWGGTPPDGATGQIYVGASPYTILHVKYSPGRTRWISQEFVMTNQNGGIAINASNITMIATALIYKWSDYITSGFRVEARYSGWTVNNQTNSTGGWKFSANSFADGNTAFPFSDTTYNTITSDTTASTTEKYFDSGWFDITTQLASAAVGIIAGFALATNTGQQTITRYPTIRWRFIG